ncbi:hypothetical protein Tco_1164527 [Tanacetum coccineum]
MRRISAKSSQENAYSQFPIWRRVSYTNASGSQHKSNTKNDRIQQTSSRSQKNKVKVQPRKFKSISNKNNHVSDCNANVKNVALSSNFENICLTFIFMDTAYGRRCIRRIGNCEYAFSCEDLALIRRISFPGYGVLVRMW